MIYTHAAAGLVGAAIAFAGAWQVQSWRYGEQISEIKADYAMASQKAESEAREKEQKQATQLAEAQNAAKKRETQLRIDAADSRHQLDRLRIELSEGIRRMPTESCDASRKRSEVTSELFGQCASEITGLAETLDRIESERQTLIQAWPK